MSSEEGHSGRQSKRQKQAQACDPCRIRKVACDGRQPCGRCIGDGKECLFAELVVRSPLTRVRMTELEDRLELHERMWSSLFPQFPIEMAEAVASRRGDPNSMGDLQVRARIAFFAGDGAGPSRVFDGLTNGGKEPESPIISRRPSQDKILQAKAAPVGGSSVIDPRFAEPTNVNEIGGGGGGGGVGGQDTYADQWHEEEPGTSRSRLDGMGSLQEQEQGMSYLGLSSGAAVLNAIRRLSKDMPKLGLDVWRPESGRPVDRPHTNGKPKADANGDAVGGHRRKLPGLPLPPFAQTAVLVDSYFAHFHTIFPTVHEPTIRAQMAGMLPLPDETDYKVLIYMILAIGAFDLATKEDDPDGSEYYQIARHALGEDVLEHGSIRMVQGLHAMANYLQRNNQPNAGYVCFGLAIRMAIGLGLHATSSHSALSPFEQESRKRTWWCLVAHEAGCSVTFGRPFGFGRLKLSRIPLPANNHDKDIGPDTWEYPPADPGSTIYTGLITQARLACVTSTIHSAILQANPSPSLEQIQRYDRLIVEVHDALPEHATNLSIPIEQELARAVTLWRIRDFRAILHRPLLLTAAWDSKRQRQLSRPVRQAISLCRTLALENLRDIRHFLQATSATASITRGTAWFSLYFGWQASLTLLLSMVWEPHAHEAPQWRETLHMTAGWMRTLGAVRGLGLSFANIIEEIIRNTGTTPSESAYVSSENTDPLRSGSAALDPAFYDPNANAVPGLPTVDAENLDAWRYWLEICGNENAIPMAGSPDPLRADSWLIGLGVGGSLGQY